VIAEEILEQYCAGKREPVQGPFTYVEAHQLVTLNRKLLESLKEITAVMHDQPSREYLAKYYNACATIGEAEAS
jgi:hypothetical protein